MPPHPPPPPSQEKAKPNFTIDLEDEDVEMPELIPLSSEEEVSFGIVDDDIPEPPGPPPPEMEDDNFHSAEGATKTESEDEYINRDDPSYRPPPIPAHPCQSYSTVRTPGTEGSLIWTKIRDLMKEIPAPGAMQWNASDSWLNTGQKTGERERLLNKVARERLKRAPSITGDGWQEAMETYIDCLPGRPQDTLIGDGKLNTTTPQLGIAYYNLGNLCRPR